MADRTSKKVQDDPSMDISTPRQSKDGTLVVPIIAPASEKRDGQVHRSESVVTDTSDVIKITKSVTFGEAKSSEEHPQTRSRRWSIHDGAADEEQPRGIYWRSPNSMVAFFVFGVMFCVGHHLYYASWNRKEVGSNNKQQWVLRFGTGFAYLAQVSLVCSTGLAFTQYLWMTLKEQRVSVLALDAAFEADQTILSLFNLEFVWKMRVVAFLSLIAWCLPIPSLVTPGTLLVLPHFYSSPVQNNVSRVDYYSLNQTGMSTYSVNFTTSDNIIHSLFHGPRTLISRLTTATATLGAILPIGAPFPIASYSLEFLGPAIQCEKANSSTATVIDVLRNKSVTTNTQDNIQQFANYYFAFVPDFSGAGNSSRPDNGVGLVSTTRLQQPVSASNQLWMVYSQYVLDDQGVRGIKDYFSVCQLYNASYHVDIIFNQTLQNVTGTKVELLNLVEYPDKNAPYSLDLMVQHAYSAYMWAITDLLVGSVGLYRDNSTSSSSFSFSEITTQIEHTALLGTSDLDVFFDKNHALTSNDTIVGPQRQQDINLAGNRTLEVLIHELGFNTTMSLMSSNSTSPDFVTTVNQTRLINVYSYNSAPLLISYGISIGFAFIAILLGGFAYYKNGHSHSRSFSSILASTRAAELADLFHAERMGRLPLHDNVARTRLIFERWGAKPGSAQDAGGDGAAVANVDSKGQQETTKDGKEEDGKETEVGWGFQISHLGNENLWERWRKNVLGAYGAIGIRIRTNKRKDKDKDKDDDGSQQGKGGEKMQ